MHDWVYFEYTVLKNMEICNLNSSTHDLNNISSKNRSNNTKINESLLNILCSSLVKMVSD